MKLTNLIQHAENAEVLVRLQGQFYPITKDVLHGLGTIIAEDVDGNLFCADDKTSVRSFFVIYEKGRRKILFRSSEGDHMVIDMVLTIFASGYAWCAALAGMYGGDDMVRVDDDTWERMCNFIHSDCESPVSDKTLKQDNCVMDSLYQEFGDDELIIQNPHLVDLIQSTDADLLVKYEGTFYPLSENDLFRIGTYMASTIAESGNTTRIPDALSNGDYWYVALQLKYGGRITRKVIH